VDRDVRDDECTELRRTLEVDVDVVVAAIQPRRQS
jgi:hypothetical protein